MSFVQVPNVMPPLTDRGRHCELSELVKEEMMLNLGLKFTNRIISGV